MLKRRALSPLSDEDFYPVRRLRRQTTDSTCDPTKKQRRLTTDNTYDINDIVIPYSFSAATRVEQIQYKEIITPKWRMADKGEKNEVKKEKKEIQDDLLTSDYMDEYHGMVPVMIDGKEEMVRKSIHIVIVLYPPPLLSC